MSQCWAHHDPQTFKSRNEKWDSEAAAGSYPTYFHDATQDDFRIFQANSAADHRNEPRWPKLVASEEQTANLESQTVRP